MEYNIQIERGHSEIADYCTDYIKKKITGEYLDIGCNTGLLLSEVPGGIGVEQSEQLYKKAIEKGLEVYHASGDKLPFYAGSFDTVVINSVLEQCHDWKAVLKEAIRVTRHKVIGINPIPGSQWGKVGGWVKSVIEPTFILYDSDFEEYNGAVHFIGHDKYYFELVKINNE